MRLENTQKLLVTGASAIVTWTLLKRIARGGSGSQCPPQRQLQLSAAAWSSIPPPTVTSDAAATEKAAESERAGGIRPQQQTALLLSAAALLAVAGATASRSLVVAAVAPTPLLVALLVLLSFLLGAVCATAAAGASDSSSDKNRRQDSVVPAATPPPPPPVKVNPDMTGVWVKDPQLSDPMDPACDVMQLNGVIRMAVRLVRGIEVRITEPWQGGPGMFEMAVFSVFPWFKVRERYELNGVISMWNRRDLRPGKHRGGVRVLPSGNLLVQLEWDEPHGGHGTDEFIVVSQDELHVKSTLHATARPGQPVVYQTVYRRKQ